MPIRFRCAYCSQLMSIATRKAGVVIRCTKCAGEIIVPVPEEQTTSDAVDPPGAGQAFESDNFDVELEGTTHATVAPTATSPPAAAPPESRPRGVFLSIAMLCVSIGIVILLLILMFIAGYFIGRSAAGASV